MEDGLLPGKRAPVIRILPDLAKLVVAPLTGQLVSAIEILGQRIPFGGKGVFIGARQVFLRPAGDLIEILSSSIALTTPSKVLMVPMKSATKRLHGYS